MSINFYDQTEKEKRLINPIELWELLEKVYYRHFPAPECPADYVAGKSWGIRQLALAVQEHLDGKITRLKTMAGGEEMKCPDCGSENGLDHQHLICRWCDARISSEDLLSPTELLLLIEKAQHTHHTDAAILHLVKSYLNGDTSSLKKLTGGKE